ncbi:hypothetical protein V8C44DRAFT_349930 [Trichoderma aethiopicum]
MASTCGPTCPTENGFFANGLNVGGGAVFLAAFASLTPATFYLGYRFRTPGFSAMLATGIAFEVFGFLGRILLHQARDRQGYFALMLLGSVLGPTFVSGAMSMVLPHLFAIHGQGRGPRQSILGIFFLWALFIGSFILNVVGIVFVAYGYGNRDRSADIIVGGLGAQALLLLAIMGAYVCFSTGLCLSAEALDPAHADIYHSTRFSRFLRCMEVAALLLFAHTVYRIFEMIGGLSGTLFQSESAFMVMDGLVPFFACLLLTTAQPGAAFGPSWASTSPRHLKRRGLSLPPLQTSFGVGHAVHHRYDPNIRQQFSPSTQRPLREAKPPPTYGSYGLPSSPRPVNRPQSPMILSPISVRAVSIGRLSDRSDGWAAQADLVDRDVLW